MYLLMFEQTVLYKNELHLRQLKDNEQFDWKVPLKLVGQLLQTGVRRISQLFNVLNRF
jgi:hypothetical protein